MRDEPRSVSIRPRRATERPAHSSRVRTRDSGSQRIAARVRSPRIRVSTSGADRNEHVGLRSQGSKRCGHRRRRPVAATPGLLQGAGQAPRHRGSVSDGLRSNGVAGRGRAPRSRCGPRPRAGRRRSPPTAAAAGRSRSPRRITIRYTAPTEIDGGHGEREPGDRRAARPPPAPRSPTERPDDLHARSHRVTQRRAIRARRTRAAPPETHRPGRRAHVLDYRLRVNGASHRQVLTVSVATAEVAPCRRGRERAGS